jgi:hypothetical protein
LDEEAVDLRASQEEEPVSMNIDAGHDSDESSESSHSDEEPEEYEREEWNAVEDTKDADEEPEDVNDDDDDEIQPYDTETVDNCFALADYED